MDSHDQPLLDQSKRVWVLTLLLGISWLGLGLPEHLWIVLGVTLAFAMVLVLPVGEKWLRWNVGFVASLLVFGGLAAGQIAGTVFERMLGNWQSLLWDVMEMPIAQSAKIIGVLAIVAMCIVAGIQLFIEPIRRYIRSPSRSTEASQQHHHSRKSSMPTKTPKRILERQSRNQMKSKKPTRIARISRIQDNESRRAQRPQSVSRRGRWPQPNEK